MVMTRFSSCAAALACALCAPLLLPTKALAQPAVGAHPAKPVVPAGRALTATALAGKARAMVHVLPDGTVLGSKGVVGVTHVLTGEWCVQLDPKIDVTTSAPIVTNDWGASPSWSSTALYGAVGACGWTGGSPSNSVTVLTASLDGGTLTYADEAFWVVVP